MGQLANTGDWKALQEKLERVGLCFELQLLRHPDTESLPRVSCLDHDDGAAAWVLLHRNKDALAALTSALFRTQT